MGEIVVMDAERNDRSVDLYCSSESPKAFDIFSKSFIAVSKPAKYPCMIHLLYLKHGLMLRECDLLNEG